MDPIMEKDIQLAAFLGETLPISYEVLLFDLTRESMPLVTQHNGDKKMIAEVRKVLKAAQKNETILANGMLLNHGIGVLPRGLAKLSAYFRQDEAGETVGALCLVMHMDAYLTLSQILESATKLNLEDIEEVRPQRHEAQLFQEPTLQTIDEMVREFTDEPERMTPDEKNELLLDLYDAGIFSLKGAVARAADAMELSEKSVYRYLAKIRRARGE